MAKEALRVGECGVCCKVRPIAELKLITITINKDTGAVSAETYICQEHTEQDVITTLRGWTEITGQ